MMWLAAAAIAMIGPAQGRPLPGRPAAVSDAPSSAPRGFRAVFLDNGIMRWRDNRQEVALFGANYVVHTASDYRAAGHVGGPRKRMIDRDVAHMARMGWDGLRLTFWGDWEASDSAGNLLENEHLDLLDYLIFRARERGMYMLFSPIQLYSSNWPDAQERDAQTPGFGRVFGKQRMGLDPAAIAAQQNYLRQILDHVNPYTGVALKNEPAIIMIELVNEPWHHPEDLPGSVAYINALVDAVRSTGCDKLIFYNVSQDFRIGEAIRQSRAQGVTFGWYPTGLNSGRELAGNYLRGVDAFPDMLRPEIARLPRIVYEFDAPDLRNATMYPAMVRTMRDVGAQAALMFAYDMAETASRNLGWQTHYLSLPYTPRKAMSTVIAAEAMRRLPNGQRAAGRGQRAAYPANLRFGDFRIQPDSDLAELVTRDVFIHAGSTATMPPNPAALTRIAGVGSSPLVRYEGLGAWFLDRVRPGLWRLEVYPDALPVRDPFEPMSPGKIVTRLVHRRHPMRIALPDLGERFRVRPLTPAGVETEAQGDQVEVTPGVYVLSTASVSLQDLPQRIGHLGFSEHLMPPNDFGPTTVTPLHLPQYLEGLDAELRARVVTQHAPDSVTLFVRRTAGDWYRAYRMRPAGAYEYAASVPGTLLREGPYEFVVSVFERGRTATFPEGLDRIPWAWDYYARDSWRFDVVAPATPLVLFDPARDASRLAFTRIGDAGRRGLYRLGISPASGRPLFHFELPVDSSGWSPGDYTASLVVLDQVRARGDAMAGASALSLRARGLGPSQTVHVTLMEDDGTSWSFPLVLDSAWADHVIPLARLAAARGVLLPQGFPGEWNYWVGPAEGRGGAGDRVRPRHIERLQVSVRRPEGGRAAPGGYGIELESVTLMFAR